MTWRAACGNVEYLGRVDHQVKLRGFRIELGEIEAALLAQPGVREAVVVAQGGAVATRLVGYVAGDVMVEPLRLQLRAALPEYMVPSQLVVLDALPRAPSGKVDRKRLPAPEAAVHEFVAPRSDARGELPAAIKHIKESPRTVPARGIGYGVLAQLGEERARTVLAALPKPKIAFN